MSLWMGTVAAEAGGSSMHAAIAVPHIAEQHRIVAKVNELMMLWTVWKRA